MNWRRGFFRLWLAIAVLWIGVTGVGLRIDRQVSDYWFFLRHPPQPVDLLKELPDKPKASELIERLLDTPERTKDQVVSNLKTDAEVVLLPPTLLAFAGLVVGWIVRGFSTHSSKTINAQK